MGTVVSFLIDSENLTDEQIHAAIDEACSELHRLDDRFSTWKPESEVSLFRDGKVDLPSKLFDEVFQLCAEACSASKGYFDPWAMVGGFDPTGLVKGWAAERALTILAQQGVGAALINAGGDICVLPGKSYEVGIRHPVHADALCAIVSTNSSIASSGVYERGNHLINPYGGPVAGISATVVGGRLALSDALATALVVGGKPVLYQLELIEGVEGFFIDSDGAMFSTSGMVFSNKSVST